MPPVPAVQDEAQQNPPPQYPLWQAPDETQADPTGERAVHVPPAQDRPDWQSPLDVHEPPLPLPPTQAPLTHAVAVPQFFPHAPQLDGSEVVVSQNVPHSVPVQVSVSPAAVILYSTSRFASAPVFEAQVEPVRKMDCRVAPAAKVITIGPLSDQ